MDHIEDFAAYHQQLSLNRGRKTKRIGYFIKNNIQCFKIRRKS